MGIELDKSTLDEIQASLERLVMGKESNPIPYGGRVPEMTAIIELINILAVNLSELNGFVKNLSKGQLSSPVPGRRNYLAGALKELHSQMSSYVWIAEQLEAGKVVDKIDFAGEFGEALNKIIDKFAHGNTPVVSETAGVIVGEVASISSYQFHQLYLAFNHLRMMIMEVDENGKVLIANKAARKFFGEFEYFSEDSVYEEHHDFVSVINSLSAGVVDYPQIHELYDEETQLWYKVTIDNIQFPNRQNVTMYIIEDISESKTVAKALEKDATIDYLTNTANRRVGMKALEKVLKNPNRDVCYCAAFMDINSLKYINDTFGHVEGDYAIKSIADVLLSSVRTTDTVSRFGGDEFLIIFARCTMAEAEHIISRMYKKVESINDMNLKPYELAFAHGTVEINDQTQLSVKETLMLLDKKMYERKERIKSKKNQMH